MQMQSSASSIAFAATPQPLAVVEGYELHHLSSCDLDSVAASFADICQRGNPLLIGRPQIDLLHLGRALYRKSVQCSSSVVFLDGSTPVALMMGWDAFDGGVWDDEAPPKSLACHAAVGTAVWAGVPNLASLMPGSIFYLAFGGVCPGYPANLFHASSVFGLFTALGQGFRYSLGYTVHPSLLKSRAKTRAEIGPSQDPEWTVVLAEIESTEEVSRELASLRPGIADCWLNSVALSIFHMDHAKKMDPKLGEIIDMAQAAARTTFIHGMEISGFDVVVASQL